MDQRKELTRQVERIIDEGSGAQRSVIVQMGANERTNDRLLSIAAEVHRRRTLTISARELLPAPQDKLQQVRDVAGKRLTASAKRTLSSSEASLAIQVGVALLPVAQGLLREAGLGFLAPLLDHDTVKRALAETSTKKSEKQSTPISPQERPAFWTSKSAVLNLSKGDLVQRALNSSVVVFGIAAGNLTAKLPSDLRRAVLARLPKEIPQIQNIYPNRTLRLPRLVEMKNVPSEIQDEKASAWGVSRIGALAAWGAYGARGKGSRVAVLDTGVDAEHPDLKGKVTAWAEFDQDGYPVPDSVAHDSDQHGTHCAGIIVGGNASGSWIGVAPEAEIAAALVLKGGVGSDAQILAGLEWAVEQNVDVISMSLGGLTLDVEPPDPYTEALLSALAVGIPLVTAIGNDGSQTTGSPGNDWFAFSVGATDYRDRSAGFSGGRTHVIRTSKYLNPDVLPLVYSKPELSAPGVAVNSAIPGGKWAYFNGTSMATPHVAGAIALLLSATSLHTSVRDAQRAFLIQDLLTGSVEELGEAGQDHRYGFGRIEVLRAIGFARDLGY